MPAIASPFRWSEVRGSWVLLLLLLGLASHPARADDVPVDAASGLRIAPGWELVRGHCGACHSYGLITAQRGGRDYWLKTIRWMQQTQNLWPLPAAVEAPLLDYLATHYNETDWGRRPALPPALMPPSGR
jgi:hypothetical protein